MTRTPATAKTQHSTTMVYKRMWRRSFSQPQNRNSFVPILNNHLGDYPTPANLNYMWSFGVLASVCLIVQIITGVVLVMHFSANTASAFSDVEHIVRDV